MSYFTSEHIKLRALEPSDLEMMYDIENDDQFWILSNTIQPYSKNTLKSFIKNAHLDIYAARQLRLVITHKSASIGYIDLFDFEPLHKRVGLGILIKKEYQNKGFASESLQLVKTYCFGYLNIHQIQVQIAVDNTHSIQLFQNNGFKISGEMLDWIQDGKGFKNVYFLQCINSL